MLSRGENVEADAQMALAPSVAEGNFGDGFRALVNDQIYENGSSSRVSKLHRE